MITYFLNPADLERLTAIDLAERARLCDPTSIDAAFATVANIAARAELARVRREVARRAIRKTVKPYQLPLPIKEAA